MLALCSLPAHQVRTVVVALLAARDERHCHSDTPMCSGDLPRAWASWRKLHRLPGLASTAALETSSLPVQSRKLVVARFAFPHPLSALPLWKHFSACLTKKFVRVTASSAHCCTFPMQRLDAYIRGVRAYVIGLANGRIAGKNADQVIASLIKHGREKNADLLKKIVPVWTDPNGALKVASVKKDFSEGEGIHQRLGEPGRIDRRYFRGCCRQKTWTLQELARARNNGSCGRGGGQKGSAANQDVEWKT